MSEIVGVDDANERIVTQDFYSSQERRKKGKGGQKKKKKRRKISSQIQKRKKQQQELQSELIYNFLSICELSSQRNKKKSGESEQMKRTFFCTNVPLLPMTNVQTSLD